MTLRDELLADLSAIRGIPAELGLHDITVQLRVETFASGAAKTSTAIKSTSTVTLSPQPRVRKAGDEPSYYGGAVDQARGGEARLLVFDIGPITPRALDGTGYDLHDLLTHTTTPSRRVVVLLSGGELGAAALPFEVLPEGTDTNPFRVMLRVRQTQAL